MNILVIAHYGLYEDLSYSFVHMQVREYVKMGNKVMVVVPIAYGKRGAAGRRFKLKEKRTVDGVEICYCRFASLSIAGQYGFNSGSAAAAVSILLHEAIESFRPDMIHANTITFDGSLGGTLKKRFNVPLVITTHGGDITAPVNDGKQNYVKKICDRADMVVAVSSKLMRLIDGCGVKTRKTVILNGFDVRNINSAPKKKHSIIYVGALIPRKNADLLIRAFSKIVFQYPDSTLVIVGAGPERERLFTLCDQCGVKNQVEFTGQLSNREVLQRMSESQIFCLPSVNEGFGIVYLEAMASGCVTIGTQGEGISDLIESDVNGILVAPNDETAIVKAIEKCFSNSLYADSLMKNGKKDACRMTWERNAEEYIKIFKYLVEDAESERFIQC